MNAKRAAGDLATASAWRAWLMANDASHVWASAEAQENHELMARLRRRFAQLYPPRQRLRPVQT